MGSPEGRDLDELKGSAPHAERASRSDRWSRALVAAGALAPAAAWRTRLAREVRQASGARWVAVFTCPPGVPVEAEVAVSPARFRRVVDRIHASFLPRIEQGASGMRLATKVRAASYAPLLATRDRALATELHREVLAPEGTEGLLNAFLVAGDAPPLGWIGVGTASSSRDALREHGAALGEVASAAAHTLAAALELARACGARVAVEPAVEALSARERQIAALVAEGLSDANVAARLSLSEETIGSHLRRVYRKLGVHSRVELVVRLRAPERRAFVLAE